MVTMQIGEKIYTYTFLQYQLIQAVVAIAMVWAGWYMRGQLKR